MLFCLGAGAVPKEDECHFLTSDDDDDAYDDDEEEKVLDDFYEEYRRRHHQHHRCHHLSYDGKQRCRRESQDNRINAGLLQQQQSATGDGNVTESKSASSSLCTALRYRRRGRRTATGGDSATGKTGRTTAGTTFLRRSASSAAATSHSAASKFVDTTSTAAAAAAVVGNSNSGSSGNINGGTITPDGRSSPAAAVATNAIPTTTPTSNNNQTARFLSKLGPAGLTRKWSQLIGGNGGTGTGAGCHHHQAATPKGTEHLQREALRKSTEAAANALFNKTVNENCQRYIRLPASSNNKVDHNQQIADNSNKTISHQCAAAAAVVVASSPANKSQSSSLSSSSSSVASSPSSGRSCLSPSSVVSPPASPPLLVPRSANNPPPRPKTGKPTRFLTNKSSTTTTTITAQAPIIVSASTTTTTTLTSSPTMSTAIRTKSAAIIAESPSSQPAAAAATLLHQNGDQLSSSTTITITSSSSNNNTTLMSSSSSETATTTTMPSWSSSTTLASSSSSSSSTTTTAAGSVAVTAWSSSNSTTSTTTTTTNAAASGWHNTNCNNNSSSSSSSSANHGGGGGGGSGNGHNHHHQHQQFINKPPRGWLHPDHKLTDSDQGVTYTVRYIGCLGVNTSMKSLDFQTRSLIAKESINRVCEAAGLKTADKKRRVDKRIAGMLADSPNMEHAGVDVNLSITISYLTLTLADTGEPLAKHEMPNISFASGGDTDTLDFAAYVAKDSRFERACFVLECEGGRAQEVITTIGQAFELRFNEFLKRNPMSSERLDTANHLNGLGSSQSAAAAVAPQRIADDREYYNDLPGKIPPDINNSNAVNGNKMVPPLAAPRTTKNGTKPLVQVNLIDLNDDNNGGACSKAQTTTTTAGVLAKPLPADPQYVNCTAETSTTASAVTDKDPFDMQPFNNALAVHAEKSLIGADAKPSTSMAVATEFPVLNSDLSKEEWFHGPISRKDSETLVIRDGDFLVRESQASPGQYVLTGMQGGSRKHLLLVDPEGVVRTKDKTFENVSHLINYHRNNGLPIISSESALVLTNPILTTTMPKKPPH